MFEVKEIEGKYVIYKNGYSLGENFEFNLEKNAEIICSIMNLDSKNKQLLTRCEKVKVLNELKKLDVSGYPIDRDYVFVENNKYNRDKLKEIGYTKKELISYTESGQTKEDRGGIIDLTDLGFKFADGYSKEEGFIYVNDVFYEEDELLNLTMYERLIPMDPLEQTGYGKDENRDTCNGLCPKCNNNIFNTTPRSKRISYCNRCGQAIKWY